MRQAHERAGTMDANSTATAWEESAVMRRMTLRKAQMCKWRAQAALPTLNRKQIREGELRDVLRLPRLALSRLRRLSLHVTFFSGFSE